MKNKTILKQNAMVFKIFLAVIAIWIINFKVLSSTGTVLTIKYYSTTQNDSCFMNIYLPPGYNDEADSNNHYPVFYLMHGGGENYTYWIRAGFADTVLNDFIPKGKCVPMILVMPDGKNIVPETYQNEILNDVIPYIESNYRVIADKDHRGMGGLSYGGMQSLELGILHYEMFGYLAILSSGYFTGAYFDRAKSFLETGNNAANLEKSMRYFYLAEGTSYDLAYTSGINALKLFRDNEITVHYWEFSGGHQWTVWKEDFKAFTPHLFRDSTTKYISLAFQGGAIKNSTIMTHLDSLAPAPQDPTRKGYTFAGWYREPEYVDSFNFATDTIKANITLYAKWSINSYKVAFDSKGGNYTPDTAIVVYNTKINEPDKPTKSGLYFGGWYTDEAYTQKWVFTSFPVTDNMILYAKWSEVTSIKNETNMEISIFPNPAKSYLQIINLNSDACIDIFNMEGKLIIHNEHLESDRLINIEGIPQGVYTIVINSLKNNYRFKFIKQ